MKNEIKEILCFLADDNRVDERFYKALGKDKCKILLDYITTLQEENKKIRKMNIAKHKYAMNMEDKYITEKAKNQKAIEYGKNCLENIKDQDQYMCETRDICRMIHKNYLGILQGDNNNAKD